MAAISLLWDTKMANNLLLFLPFSLALPSGRQGGPVWGGGEGGDEGMNFKADQKIAFGAEPFCKNTLERVFQAVQNKHISSDMCSPTWGNTYP